MDTKLRQLSISLIIFTYFDAHYSALIETYIENTLFIAPVKTSCLKSKRLLPYLLECVAISLSLIVFTYLEFEGYHTSDCGIYTASNRRRRIFLSFLLILFPRHGELFNVRTSTYKYNHYVKELKSKEPLNLHW